MMNKSNILTILLLTLSTYITANNVKITNVQRELPTTGISFTITWENSWCLNATTYDAVWIFIKQRKNGGSMWTPVGISNTEITSPLLEDAEINTEHGFMIKRKCTSSSSQRTISTEVTVSMGGLLGGFEDIKIHAIEMVYVPDGGFYLGDGVSDFTYHDGNNATSPFYAKNEFFARGTGTGQLGGGRYNDPIPAGFPRGAAAFYCMKYPITQQQYCDFLNSLSREAQNTRTSVDISGTTVTNTNVMEFNSTGYFCSIRCASTLPSSGPIEFFVDRNRDGDGDDIDDGHHQIMILMTDQDLLAYLDWAGLAPMTSFQYEKACRGYEPSVPYELAWGTSDCNTPTGHRNIGTPTETYLTADEKGSVPSTNFSVRAGLFATENSDTRVESGASFWGILDMSHGKGTFVLSEDQPYNGETGDGLLDVFGNNNLTNATLRLDLKSARCGSPKNEIGISANPIRRALGSRALPNSGRGVIRASL